MKNHTLSHNNSCINMLSVYNNNMYISTKVKFILAIVAATSWASLSTWLALPWINDFSQHVGQTLAVAIILGIAIVPGFVNAFLGVSLLLDRRPPRKQFTDQEYPGVTVLIAAYNEQYNIEKTLTSIHQQSYPGELEVVVIDDGSSDQTQQIVKQEQQKYPWLKLLLMIKNRGKCHALNQGLRHARHDVVITLDADSVLFKNALRHIVERYMSDPVNTGAVAGAVLVSNSRKNFVTRMQEWDYFLGIAAVKRTQSLYHGTMVAQGAFSLYRKDVLMEVGGWPDAVGEDIVLTWSIQRAGYRVGFAEDACMFTQAPDTLRQFLRQRQRWSRGLVEAFKQNWPVLFKFRMSTLFVWWNLLFPYLDVAYVFGFIPGVILACLGIFWIAGPMTIILLPLMLALNYVMYREQIKMFTSQGLKVRKNILGFLIYTVFYSAIMQPACVLGYAKELLGLNRNWGTK